MKKPAVLLLAVLLLWTGISWAGASSAWSKTLARAVKTTLGPKGRNVALDYSGRPGVVPPDPCYDYAFVSRRDRNVDNIFFANTCTPELKSATNNTSNRIGYSSLTGRLNEAAVAAIEIDFSDPTYPHPSLTTWIASGAILLPDDRNDARTLGRTAWIPARDASQPGFNKLVVSARRGSYFEEGRASRDDVDRLYVLDAATGDMEPLKDPRDFANQDVAMEGKEPAASEDGQKLAFIRNVDGLNHLWTCDLTLAPAAGEGGFQCANVQMMNAGFHEPESLTGNYDSPCWSYDAKKIFFSFDGLRASTDNHPYSKIYMVNPDGTGLRRLSADNPGGTDNEDNDSYPACLPRAP